MTQDVRELLKINEQLEQEIARRNEAEQALQQANDQLQAVLNSVPGGVSWISSDLKYLGINRYLAAVFKCDPETFIGREIGFLKSSDRFTEFVRQFFESPDKTSSREIEIEAEGARQHYLMIAQKYLGGKAAVFVSVDITERKRVEEQLRHMALYDALTGLPNRTLFMARLERAFEHAKRHKDYMLAVLFLDFDHFKNINDSLGHLVGDQLLRAIARRLEAHLRSADTVARLGGDEFTFLLEDIKDVSDATRVAERIQEEMGQSFFVDGQEVFTGVSIGIVLHTPAYERPEDLLRDADTAMYRAKALGRSRYEIFDKNMHAAVVRRLQLENDLRRALEQQELLLHYQPIVSLEAGRMSGFECLVRWRARGPEFVSPTEFIPIAEDTGLILPLDLWVLREACRQMRVWQVQSLTQPFHTISVNVSVKQFSQPGLVDYIAQTLQESELDARHLKLEITESVFLGNADSATNTLARLHELGILLSMDDFGTGYSSLSYLHRFPMDTLKIDRSFVSRIGMGGQNLEIVQAIVSLARTLGMDVVAEGVETSEQLAQLRALRCEYGQGYLFARPLDNQAAQALLAEEPRW